MRLGTEWLLTARRAAVHLPTRTAVLADPHLGYDQARRRAGDAVPLVGLDDLRAALAALIRGPGIAHVVIAGDLYEDARCSTLAEDLLTWLDGEGVTLRVVPGNHDRGLAARPGRLTLCPDGVALGDWQVVHGDRPTAAARVVQGHLHPCARWGRLAAPCFLAAAHHLVLPAFSREAAGGNVLGDARWRGYRVGVIAGDEVLDFGTGVGRARKNGGPLRTKGPP